MRIIKDGKIEYKQEYKGSNSDGSVALTNANTWYAVPSGTAPTVPYILIVSLENIAGTIRFSFDNGGTPSTTNGNIAPEQLAIEMAANTVLYYGSSVAGDDVNFTIKNKY